MNDACCSRPPFKSDYKPVGTYEKLKDGMNCYVVGPKDASRAVIILYDIFAYSHGLHLGADLLASSLKARVFIPDFFYGEKLLPTLFPMDTDEKKQKFHDFLAGAGSLSKAVSLLAGPLTKELKEITPTATKWAIAGTCWGGKVAAMVSGKQNLVPVDVSASIHPGMLDNNEARGMQIPHICLLAGEDGTPEEQQEYKKALQESGKDVEFAIFQDQVHGFMAARADFDDERVRSEFERGYDMVAAFFEKHFK